MNPVFVTGGTGYVGQPLLEALLANGHRVHVRCCDPARGDLRPPCRRAASQSREGRGVSTRRPGLDSRVGWHGAPRASPALCVRQRCAPSARDAGLHRCASGGETIVRATGIPSTILRPWYVLGPGHYWPYLLVPAYGMLRLWPATRPTAERLGVVTRSEMIAALVGAVEAPPAAGVRIVGVPEIRRAQERRP